VAEVPVDGQSAFLDIDTPQALEGRREDRSFVGWAKRSVPTIPGNARR
jgi:hypothetical protein